MNAHNITEQNAYLIVEVSREDAPRLYGRPWAEVAAGREVATERGRFVKPGYAWLRDEGGRAFLYRQGW